MHHTALMQVDVSHDPLNAVSVPKARCDCLWHFACTIAVKMEQLPESRPVATLVALNEFVQNRQQQF